MKLMPTLAAIAASVALTCSIATAQDAYPSKPVRMIIPFAPGGPADVIARLVAQKLSEDLGKQFYVENHAGAGGNTGAGLAARAPADGYSLLVTSQALVINASLYKSLPYDTFRDFIAVTRIATTPNVLVVNPSVPARTVKEVLDSASRSGGRGLSRGPYKWVRLTTFVAWLAEAGWPL